MVTELIKEVRLNYTAGDRGMDQKGHFTEPFKIKETTALQRIKESKTGKK